MDLLLIIKTYFNWVGSVLNALDSVYVYGFISFLDLFIALIVLNYIFILINGFIGLGISDMTTGLYKESGRRQAMIRYNFSKGQRY